MVAGLVVALGRNLSSARFTALDCFERKASKLKDSRLGERPGFALDGMCAVLLEKVLFLRKRICYFNIAFEWRTAILPRST